MSTCPNCGEHLEGDGYNRVLHCPNNEDDNWGFAAPDEGPFFCGPELTETGFIRRRLVDRAGNPVTVHVEPGQTLELKGTGIYVNGERKAYVREVGGAP